VVEDLAARNSSGDVVAHRVSPGREAGPLAGEVSRRRSSPPTRPAWRTSPSARERADLDHLNVRETVRKHIFGCFIEESSDPAGQRTEALPLRADRTRV